MNITAFEPVVMTPDSENVLNLFSDLGFETAHRPVGKADGEDIPIFCMKHKDGFKVDVIDNKHVPRDITSIRINVDNYEEARGILVAHGFKELYPDAPHDSDNHKGVEMVSPGGLIVTIMQHIKK